MDNSLDSLQFYVKVVTGLLLLLNLALLMSIRYGMGWASQLSASLPEAERGVVWKKASRALGGLIVVVIAVNLSMSLFILPCSVRSTPLTISRYTTDGFSTFSSVRSCSRLVARRARAR